MAEAEYKYDREILIPQAKEISWAQDAANTLLLMKYRMVDAAFKVHVRVVDVLPQNGDRSIQIIEDMKAGLKRLCSSPRRRPSAGGVPPKSADIFNFERDVDEVALTRFKRVCRNANADGAPNEQLAFRLGKVRLAYDSYVKYYVDAPMLPIPRLVLCVCAGSLLS